jgi:hypothetical protein
VVKTDLSPVWFSKENNIVDAADVVHWREDKKQFVAYNGAHPWFAVWGSTLPVIGHNTEAAAPIKTIGLGKVASVTYQLEIKPHQAITAVFVVSGSNQNSVIWSWQSRHSAHWKERLKKQTVTAASFMKCLQMALCTTRVIHRKHPILLSPYGRSLSGRAIKSFFRKCTLISRKVCTGY